MPYSNYTKIFDLLAEMAKEDVSKDIFQFAEEVRDKQIESFAIWRAEGEPGSSPVKTYCSAKSIRRLIRFISQLGFIELDGGRQCSLATYGRNALKGDNYSRALATHVAMYLNEKAGITYSEIKEIIGSIRRPEVPFFDTIYEKMTSEQDLKIGESRMRMVLYLLERCGMLTTMTRKIYFAQ
jgi:hypothetical protein